jgi:hypothetical protein
MPNNNGVIAMFSECGSDNPKREYIIIIKANLKTLLKEIIINFFHCDCIFLNVE